MMNKDNQKSEETYQAAKAFLAQGNAVLAVAMLTQAIQQAEDDTVEAQSRLLRLEALKAMGDEESVKEDENWVVSHAPAIVAYYNKVGIENPFAGVSGDFKAEGREGCGHS